MFTALGSCSHLILAWSLRKSGTDNHMRSGVSDGGGDFFTAAMNASWDDAFARELGHDPVLQEWFMNGGPLPP